ncbi:MAG: hypothetical protein NTY33_01435 [Candidatus Moranbacteria bacterium]|nr:hypothetical protein [Candidatus Moranbacteria bacterium]
MKIFIDFDDVIFNTGKFKEDFLNKVFIRNGATKADFTKTYYHFFKKNGQVDRYYDPKKQLKALGKKDYIRGDKLEKDFHIFMKNLKKYVFGDVAYFLKKISKRDLFLISYGDPLFQKMKIEGTHTSKLFGEVILGKFRKMDLISNVVEKHKLSQNDKIIVIDDLPKHLKKTKALKERLITFHLRRSEGRYKNLTCKYADYEVKNLKEIIGIIKKEKIV